MGKKTLTYILIIYFIILNIIDIITTTYGYYNFHWFPETNPIYFIIKNYWVFMIITRIFVVIGIFALLYLFKSKINLIRYVSIAFFVMFLMLYTDGMRDNIKAMKYTPEDITQMKEMVELEAEKQNIPVEKVNTNIYKERFISPLYISLLIMTFIFIIYERVTKENSK